jgi:hypothetical protein
MLEKMFKPMLSIRRAIRYDGTANFAAAMIHSVRLDRDGPRRSNNEATKTSAEKRVDCQR